MNADTGEIPKRRGLLLASIATVCMVSSASAVEPTKRADVLSLLNDGSLTSELTADGAYKLTVRLQNQTDQSLRVEFPTGLVADGFAQNPVLAQFPGGGPGGGQPGGGGSQGLGFIESREVSVVSGESVDIAIKTVCLNFGVPEPKRSTMLFLKSVDEYTPDGDVQAVLTDVASRQFETPIAQAILWHTCDKMSWNQLARLNVRGHGSFAGPTISTARQWLIDRERKASAAAEPISETESKLQRGPALSLAINPDPRGTKDSAQLVRRIAARLRESHPDITVGYRNFPAHPVTTQGAAVQWNVLIKTTASRRDGKESPIMLTVRASQWETGRRQWRLDAPDTELVRADELKSDTVGAVAHAVMNAVASRSVLVKWQGTGRTRIAVTNQLPMPLAALTVCDARKESVQARFDAKEIPAGRSVAIDLSAEQAQQLASAQRLSAREFVVQPSELARNE